MGNSTSTEAISERYSYRVGQLEPIKVLKSSLGNIQLVKESKSEQQFIIFPVYYDTDRVLKNLIQSLEDVIMSQKQGVNGYVQVQAAEVTDKKLLCSTSSFIVALDYFKMNLDDVIRANNIGYFFESESKVWCFIFTMVNILQYNSKNNVLGHFFHPRSICWLENSQSWGLIHPALFPDTSNYVEAMANKLHFCSPELYSKVSTSRNSFNIADQDRSDMFSIGLIVIYFLSKERQSSIMESIYKQNQYSVDGLTLQRLVNSLEKQNYSDLLIRVLGEMVQELEHLRISSNTFIDAFEKHRENLENENFRSHKKILDNYMDLKSSHIVMSINKEFIGNGESEKTVRLSTVIGKRMATIDPSRKAVPYSREERSGYV
jgi:hypothetical protein